jgi:hypothetical protein
MFGKTQDDENTQPGHVKISADIRTRFPKNASQRRYRFIHLGQAYINTLYSGPLDTDWTVRGSNPGGGATFRKRPGRP